MQRVIIAAVVLLASVFGTAYGDELSGGGSWQSTNAGAVKGTWSANLTQTKDAVRGTLTLDGSNVFTGGDVEGTVADGQIVLGVLQQGAKVASFAGKWDGSTVAGEWHCPAAADDGVWEGKLSIAAK